ncbi:MAG: methylmalonyl Co-A mutase-associated GTPase MeaB [Armatimonadetes bacterium]|nr:methylmalonyl Co-A mutase-associated GTPase MeaB [Armatimonadota bacterium]
MTETNIQEKAQAILAGNKRQITRALSIVENEGEGWVELLSTLYPQSGTSYRIGITGPPGAGKSTITQQMIRHYRAAGKRVAVIAIDPTSPFTGGAILGDRIRMQSETLDPGVFIRSMASRGSLGGLSAKAQELADLLAASGYDIIIFETVGVGQSELDIAKAADTTIVVLVPESGDSIQAMKSGLMEIADIFLMNKSDRDGADQAVAALKTILTFKITHDAAQWNPPVIKTVGMSGEGIAKIGEAIREHREHSEQHGMFLARRKKREEERIIEEVEHRLRQRFWTTERKDDLRAQIELVTAYSQSPTGAAMAIIEGVSITE